MRKQLRFTGVGGQGVLLAGEIMAEAKIEQSGYGIQAATYTSQVRGGPTKVDILLDENEILYPYANEGEIEFMLSTAQVSYDLFKNGVMKGGIIIIESNLVKPSADDILKWKIYEIPMISIAKYEIGNVITQSVVALAITTTFTNAINRDMVLKTMLKKVPEKVRDVNKKAFEVGEMYAKKAIANGAKKA